MKRICLLSLLLLLGLHAMAQKVRKHPLVYVPADSVFVLPRPDRNIIMEIMEVAPFAHPTPITVSREDKTSPCPDEKLLLLTGQGHYAESIEQRYFSILPQALHDPILPRSEREAAAQQLLDYTGTIYATDNRRDVYVNLFENCTSRIHTKKFRMLLDMISDFPESSQVKLRIGGLNGGTTPFTLHIRVPSWAAPTKYYVNGHEIIRPVITDGYLVISRQWRNNEEVFFRLHPTP